MIRLIGIDVDGTLVGASGRILPQVWEAAARARAAGIRLVLCSGRPAFGVTLDYARELDGDGWHVFQNGASIVHLSSGESLSVRLPEGATDPLIAHARATGRVLELYMDDHYVTESTAPWARQHAELLGVEFDPRSYETVQSPPVRAQWLVPEEEISEVLAHSPAHLEIAQSTSPLMPRTRFVGLTHSGVNKGSAIRTVAERLQISPSQTMYVGDAGNDLPALRVVGWPVAMANADPTVIAAARFVAGHVEEGGLAQAIEMALSGDVGELRAR